MKVPSSLELSQNIEKEKNAFGMVILRKNSGNGCTGYTQLKVIHK
jgi:hypothetical protein